MDEMCDEMLKDVSSTVNGAVEMLKESLEVKLKEQVAAQVQQEVSKMALVLSKVEGIVNFEEGQGALDTIHTVFDKVDSEGKTVDQVEILAPHSRRRFEMPRPSKAISGNTSVSSQVL